MLQFEACRITIVRRENVLWFPTADSTGGADLCYKSWIKVLKNGDRDRVVMYEPKVYRENLLSEKIIKNF